MKDGISIFGRKFGMKNRGRKKKKTAPLREIMQIRGVNRCKALL